jgi:hypothetical protein
MHLKEKDLRGGPTMSIVIGMAILSLTLFVIVSRSPSVDLKSRDLCNFMRHLAGAAFFRAG